MAADKDIHVGDPQLPRKRKRPRRFEEGVAPPEFDSTPKYCTGECTTKLLTLSFKLSQIHLNKKVMRFTAVWKTAS